MTNVIRKIKTVVGCGLLAMLTACNGILDDIYDEPATPAAGDIYIDASDWTQWHYIDLHALKEATDKGEKPEQVYTTYDIPLEKTDSYDEDKTGIYTYWYDVFGEGISNNEFRESYPTIRQPEPKRWDLAFHRNNVRTNGGAAIETSITDISKVGSHSVFSTIDFVCDTWNQTDVWTVQDRMLQGIVGNQRIKINTELGKWLRLDIPPMPPAFTHNSNVFVVRLADGTYAAIRLKNYIGTTNRKCQLTIEYKYPICTGLDSLIILNGVENISENVFANCTNLSYVSLPNSVDFYKSAYDIFSGCKNIKSVFLNKSNEKIPGARSVSLPRESFLFGKRTLTGC